MSLALDTDVLVSWAMNGAPRHAAAGVRRLATFNRRDFEVFPFLEIVEV